MTSTEADNLHPTARVDIGNVRDDDAMLAIRLLGASKWYQAGHMDAESLMNVLERIAGIKR